MFTRHKNKKAITLWVDSSTIEAIDKLLAQRLARTSRQALLLEALNILLKTEADSVLQAACTTSSSYTLFN